MKLTWIYLMRDQATGLYKIGKSDTPSKRLHDLCRQDTKQPTPNDYELIEAWWADEKKEFELHDIYSNERCRGEWFDLSPTDITNIRRYFVAHQPYSKEVLNTDASELQLAAQDNVRLRGELRRVSIQRLQEYGTQSSLRMELFDARARIKQLEGIGDYSPKPQGSRLRNLPKLSDVIKEARG